MRILSGAGAFTSPPADRSTNYDEHLRVPDMSVGTYSLPAGTIDVQTPHDQDEIYVVTAGCARFVSDDGEADVGPGDVIYVPRGEDHRFAEISADLAVIVLFAPAET